MHHADSGINFQIHSVSLASHVSTHFLIHLSAHLCHHHHSHHPSLLHSFTPGSKPTSSTNPSHLNTSTLDCLHNHGSELDLSCFAIYFKFILSLIFLFVLVWWTKLATSQLFTARKIHSIVSYRTHTISQFNITNSWPHNKLQM